MPLLFLRVARGATWRLGFPEWIPPVVMTPACCSGMLVAALAVLVMGI
jgi:hypothetical protein